MKRRKVLGILLGAAAWPLAARAQQPPTPIVGFLNVASPEGFAHLVAAFRGGLKESGYIEGQNVAVEYRWAGGQYDRLPDMAADLVRRQVSVIVANPCQSGCEDRDEHDPHCFHHRYGSGSTGPGLEFEQARRQPYRRDPVERTARAETTGVGARVNASRQYSGAPFEPERSAAAEIVQKEAQAAASLLGLQLHILRASTEAEIEAAFAGFSRLKAGVLVIGADAFFSAKSPLFAEFSLRYAVPAIYQNNEFANAGGLMSYGGSATDAYHLAGIYTGRILKGEQPADLPVQQSIKVELIVNLTTAKELGIAVPLSILAAPTGSSNNYCST